jgi:hypothetical protein
LIRKKRCFWDTPRAPEDLSERPENGALEKSRGCRFLSQSTRPMAVCAPATGETSARARRISVSKSMGLFLLLGAFAVGCGDKGGTTGGESSGKPASTSGGAAAGIPECDANVKKYDEVIEGMKKCKVPDAGKAAWDSGIKTMEDSKKALQDASKAYKDLDAAGRKAAADGCKASAAAITAMPCPGG